MDISGIAFDCCWLKELDAKGFDEQYAAMQLVDRMVRCGVAMLLDHEKHIDGEYCKNVPGHTVGGKIVAKLKKTSSICYFSGKPKVTCVSALEADGFDPSDIPYVGAAQNGKGLLITSEEKHLASARVELISKKCRVIIVGSDEISGILL